MSTNSLEYRKGTNLLEIFKSFFKKDMNLARIKFIVLILQALCRVQMVSLYKLSTAFDGPGDHLSHHRRIQRFIAKYQLDMDLVSRFIFALLPVKTGLVLSMDRTNWKFGRFDINALMLGVTYEGVAFPLMFTMLPKRGNSNTEERIRLIRRFIRLFGKGCIDCLTADREFVGRNWIGFLNDLGIRYHIRIKENFWVQNPKSSEPTRVRHLFHSLRLGQAAHLVRIFIVHGQYCYLSASRIKNKEGQPELQIIISYSKPEEGVGQYKKRWQIETCFKTMKSAGFNIEDTHLADMERLERLFALVCMALVWSYVVGLEKHLKVKPIKVLPHKRKAKSFVKYGMEEIAHALNSNGYTSPIDIYAPLMRSLLNLSST